MWSQTNGDGFDKFLAKARSLYDVSVYDNNSDVGNMESGLFDNENNELKHLEGGLMADDRIGKKVVLYPSMMRGTITNTRIGNMGRKRLEVRTGDNKITEIDDLPYLYRIIK